MNLKVLILACIIPFTFVSCGDNQNITNLQDGQRGQLIEINEDKVKLWEKEKQTFSISSIALDKEWDKKIVLDNIVVEANKMNDISIIPNYFFNKDSSHIGLESTYKSPTIMYSQKSEIENKKDKLWTQIEVTTTSYNEGSIIENIKATLTPNHFEDGFKALEEKAPYKSGDKFGFGSKMEQVRGILGEHIDEFDTTLNDKVKLKTLVYLKDNMELLLTFSQYNNQPLAKTPLTSIYWIPLNFNKELHTQENIESFIKGNSYVSDIDEKKEK